MNSQQMLLMVTRNTFPQTEISSQAFGGRGRVRAQALPEGSCYTRKMKRFGSKRTEKIFHAGWGPMETHACFSPANKCCSLRQHEKRGKGGHPRLLVGFGELFLMESLSSLRIWFFPPSAKAGMNQSLQTLIPLVSKGERERNSQKRIKLGLPGVSRTLKCNNFTTGIWTEGLNGWSHGRRSEL